MGWVVRETMLINRTMLDEDAAQQAAWRSLRSGRSSGARNYDDRRNRSWSSRGSRVAQLVHGQSGSNFGCSSSAPVVRTPCGFRAPSLRSPLTPGRHHALHDFGPQLHISLASRGPRVSPLERDGNGGRRQDVRTGRALVLPLVALFASGVQPIVPGRPVVPRRFRRAYAAAPANARSNALGSVHHV
jgi:hypothetical protein